MPRVAIIGSRKYTDLDAVRKYVASLPEGTELVLAGPAAKDSVARVAAEEGKRKGFQLHHYHVRLDLGFGSKAAMMRGRLMVESSDRLVAFHTGSEGTWMTCEYAAKLGREVLVFP